MSEKAVSCVVSTRSRLAFRRPVAGRGLDARRRRHADRNELLFRAFCTNILNEYSSMNIISEPSQPAFCRVVEQFCDRRPPAPKRSKLSKNLRNVCPTATVKEPADLPRLAEHGGGRTKVLAKSAPRSRPSRFNSPTRNLGSIWFSPPYVRAQSQSASALSAMRKVQDVS